MNLEEEAKRVNTTRAEMDALKVEDSRRVGKVANLSVDDAKSRF